MISEADKPTIETSSDVSSQMTQRAYLNALSSLLDYVSRIGVSFIVTPILVNGLGSALFGVWQVLSRLVGYVSATDGRPTQALKWVIATYQGVEDSSIKRQAVGSALGAWLLSIPLVGIIGLAIVWLSPTVTNVPTHQSTLVRVACSLLVIDLMLTGLLTLPAAVLRGMNLGYKRMGVVASMNILGGVLAVSAVYLDWGLIGVVGASVVQGILTGVLFWYLTSIYVPWFGVEKVSFAKVRRFFGLSVWYAGWDLVNKLLTSSDVVILGILISTSMVTNYVLTGYVSQALIAVATMAVGSAVPGLGKLVGQKEYHRVFRLRSEMLWLSLLFSMIVGSMILLWNRSFVTLWAGREHYAGLWVNFLLVLLAVQLLLLRNETYLIDLTLDLRQKVTLGMLSALLSIGLSLLLIPSLDVIGLCLGFLVGRSLLTVAYPRIVNSLLKTTATTPHRLILRPLLVMSALFIISMYVGDQLLVNSWPELIAYATTSLPFVLILSFWVGFSREQRQIISRRVRNVNPLKVGL